MHGRPLSVMGTIAVVILTLGYSGPVAQRRGRGGRASRTSGPMTKHEVKNAAKRQAVCNDGSPAAYYFKEGEGQDRRKWIVFLQGGGGCGSDASCAARSREDPHLMTSSGLPGQHTPDGLLSDDDAVNPDFARYTHVLLHYCSSDAYAGDAARTVGGRTLQFRGHRIVDAVFEDLMDSSAVGSPTLGDATEVLVAGSSAGALGVHNNIDRIAARLSGKTVKAVSDSGWVPDIAPFGPGTMEVRPDAPSLVDYFHALPDESCAAANAGQTGKCLLGSFVFRYITTPMFVYADQRDALHLGTLGAGGRGGAAGPDQRAYVQRYMQAVRDSLREVPAVFSPAIGGHTSLQNERFHEATIEGHTLAETLGAWYFGRPGPVKLVSPDTGRRGH